MKKDTRGRPVKVIEGKSLQQWADHYGVSKQTMIFQHKKGIALSTYEPKVRRTRNKTYDGKTIKQWAEHYGVGYDTIRTRMSRNENGHTNSVLSKEMIEKYGKKITDIAKDEGVSRTMLYKRIKRFGTPFAQEIAKIKLDI